MNHKPREEDRNRFEKVVIFPIIQLVSVFLFQSSAFLAPSSTLIALPSQLTYFASSSGSSSERPKILLKNANDKNSAKFWTSGAWIASAYVFEPKKRVSECEAERQKMFNL